VTFKDHFSQQADRYTRFRPHYPRELFAYLASLSRERGRAWDCGTGSGQAAVALAEYFAEVVGSDPSARQIEHAVPHPRVTYLLASAESCPLADDSIDLVTVAQALHWFNLEKFYAEVRRVGRRGSVIAIWAYGLATITPQVDAVVQRLYAEIVGSYWPPERGVVEEGYRSVPFPFEELPAPELKMSAHWTLDGLLGYLSTWSSVQKYLEQNGTNPLDLIRADMAAAWQSPAETRLVEWPLTLRVGRIKPA